MCISVTETRERPELLGQIRRKRGSTARATPTSEVCPPFGRIAARLMLSALAVCVSVQTGCIVGPKYARPSVPAPPAYKELQLEDAQGQGNWKTARPNDAAVRGKWWEAYHDPQLNELEEKAESSNQNIAAAMANFLAARAFVRQARSQYFSNRHNQSEHREFAPVCRRVRGSTNRKLFGSNRQIVYRLLATF